MVHNVLCDFPWSHKQYQNIYYSRYSNRNSHSFHTYQFCNLFRLLFCFVVDNNVVRTTQYPKNKKSRGVRSDDLGS